jgi:hypothetical protein
VRGGKWCAIEMCYPPAEIANDITNINMNNDQSIIPELVQKPQSLGFFETLFSGINTHIEQTRLNNQKKMLEIEEITRICGRCGRNSHLSKSCFSKTHLNGRKL